MPFPPQTPQSVNQSVSRATVVACRAAMIRNKFPVGETFFKLEEFELEVGVPPPSWAADELAGPPVGCSV